MDNKKAVFVMEVENGYLVEVPSVGKKWLYISLDEAMLKAVELMTPAEVAVVRPTTK